MILEKENSYQGARYENIYYCRKISPIMYVNDTHSADNSINNRDK